MRILQVNPYEVKSFTRNCDNVYRNRISVGKCNDDDYYMSDLTFPPVLINCNEILIKAVLKMYCKTVCGSQDHLNICMNHDRVNLDIFGTGRYDWDVTSLVKCECECDFNFCAYTKDLISGCCIKEFEALEYSKEPVLELTLEERPPKPEHNVVNIVKEYQSTALLKYSDWIDCISLNQYYYFIDNLGSSDVELLIEISPDKNLVFQDSGPFQLQSNKVSYLQPMRESRFVRISYQNLTLNDPNLINVWFQGKK